MNPFLHITGRIWTVLFLTGMALGQVRTAHAHPSGFFAQQDPICFVMAKVDPQDYYPIQGNGVPTARHVTWELECSLGTGPAAVEQPGNTLIAHKAGCVQEVRVAPQDYYPIQGAGVPTGRTAVLVEVCASATQ